jgi:hypothetical protein
MTVNYRGICFITLAQGFGIKILLKNVIVSTFFFATDGGAK